MDHDRCIRDILFYSWLDDDLERSLAFCVEYRRLLGALLSAITGWVLNGCVEIPVTKPTDEQLAANSSGWNVKAAVLEIQQLYLRRKDELGLPVRKHRRDAGEGVHMPHTTFQVWCLMLHESRTSHVTTRIRSAFEQWVEDEIRKTDELIKSLNSAMM